MKVLFVCLGNICRSPMAEGVLRDLALKLGVELEIDSAGTSGFHIGESPDPRAISCLLNKGIDITDLKARQIQHSDYLYYDSIFVMDRNNLKDVLNNCPKEELKSKVQLFRFFAIDAKDQIIPDPYYGGLHDFEKVYELCNEASSHFLKNNFKPI